MTIGKLHPAFGKRHTESADYDLNLASYFVGEIKRQFFLPNAVTGVFSHDKKSLVGETDPNWLYLPKSQI